MLLSHCILLFFFNLCNSQIAWNFVGVINHRLYQLKIQGMSFSSPSKSCQSTFPCTGLLQSCRLLVWLGGISVCASNWHITNCFSLPMSLVLHFAPRTYMPSAPAQGEPQAPIGSSCRVLYLLRMHSGPETLLPGSWLLFFIAPGLLSFLSETCVDDLLSLWVSFYFWLNISECTQVHTLWPIGQSFPLPYFIQVPIHLRE